ncbi:MAG: phosphopentomutase, partial [Verrucomicrobiota bacterium]
MRALLLILDGLGCGSVAEAGKADTLGHIFAAHPSLQLPALFSLGLWKIMTADVFDPRSQHSRASYGRMRAHSPGEHSITGHWEMAGLLLDAPFERFERFPGELVHAIEKETGIEFLGNRRQEQAAILREFGAAHCASGKPVLYASAGSAMEIAVHQEVMGKKRLDRICRVARRHARKWRISRVISHCFTGKPGSFKSGYGVDEYPVVPPRTVLNAIAETGSRVEALGKVHRLFAGSGITASHVTHCNLETTDAIDQLWPDLDDGLLFANLGDFDS